ncbi:hypothetical protein DPM19_23070 [Actinomadura craniellae]|uniref:Uncharacterized protein n=1 Tax=Actinomadura craniellae TaxID=2231787 RepID=A0A365H1C1_9ACTN|nr:DUF6338 family protein [Actinomadura craniellae]RAY12894.1 hypothetical protein DPM19_23070 [Actinomadura craniellae]
MVPSSVGSVVVFLLLVTPGAAFELLWQRTRPRRDESAFIEISRVLLTGVLLSGAAIATLMAVEALVPGAAVDLFALLRDGERYVDRHPALVVGTLAAGLAVALLYGVAAHDLLTAPTARRIAHETVWHTAFGRLPGPRARAFLSVQLRDGTTIMGYAAGYSTEPDPARRDLMLAAPLTMRRPGAEEATALAGSWQVMVVAGAEISTIAAAYVDRPAAAPGPRPRPAVPFARRRWAVALAGVLAVLAVLVVTAAL